MAIGLFARLAARHVLNDRGRGAGVKVRIDVQPGVRNIQRDLKRLSPALAKEFKGELRKVVKVVADDAKRRAPKRTGHLASRIRPSVTAKGAGVRSGARYGHVVENGGRHPVYGSNRWVNEPPRPYLRPAAQAHSKDVERGAQAAIDKAATATGWR